MGNRVPPGALTTKQDRASFQRSSSLNDLPAHVEWFLAVKSAPLLLLHVKPRKACIIYVIVREKKNFVNENEAKQKDERHAFFVLKLRV
jgi:hypothetical protein